MLAAILGQHPAGEPTAGGAAGSRCRYDGLIVDLDGMVWLGSRPVEGAAEAITTVRTSGVRVVFLPTTRNAHESSRPGG
jgi:Haloacid dehalogenase-like hydrolase